MGQLFLLFLLNILLESVRGGEGLLSAAICLADALSFPDDFLSSPVEAICPSDGAGGGSHGQSCLTGDVMGLGVAVNWRKEFGRRITARFYRMVQLQSSSAVVQN